MGNGYFNSDQNAEARFTEITYLLQIGKKIDAIKVYRQVTGASLAEARAAIENMELTGIVGMSVPQSASMQAASPAMLEFPEAVVAEIASLLQIGKKIDAIKVYRQATGASLVDAKTAIENMELTGTVGTISPQTRTVQPPTPAMIRLPEEMLAEIKHLLAQNQKIQAIKFYREQTGADLATAKNAVERIEQTMRMQGL